MPRARLLEVTLCCVLQVVLFRFSAAQFDKDVGDSCTLLSGGTGVCREFDDCDLSLLSREPPQPAICAWKQDDAIVCCPQAAGATPPPPPPPVYSTSGGSKAKQKCNEYNGLKQSVVQTIIGGEAVTNVSQYPHIALLGYGNPPKWQCGGTLISERFILTAAHCLNGNDRSPVTTAHMGFLDKRNRNQFGTLQEFRIIKTHKHPTRKLPRQYADIALLQLDRPVQITKGVRPACLHEDFNFPVKRAQAIGWGDLTDGANVGSDVLQRVQVPLVNFNECASKYPSEKRIPQGLVEETQFCAGDPGKDTCQGDSGGPLQIHDTSGVTKIIGVTSLGQQCGLVPGVYTRVSHYVRWIESIVWP